jgi:hypothetical protein
MEIDIPKELLDIPKELLDIPKELLDIILEYDGRIKYKYGKYVNIIHKYDERYNIINPFINKKREIMKTVLPIDGHSFYFEFGFDKCNKSGLCYDYNFSYKDKFEICYYNFRNGIEQIRTYI